MYYFCVCLLFIFFALPLQSITELLREHVNKESNYYHFQCKCPKPCTLKEKRTWYSTIYLQELHHSCTEKSGIYYTLVPELWRIPPRSIWTGNRLPIRGYKKQKYRNPDGRLPLQTTDSFESQTNRYRIHRKFNSDGNKESTNVLHSLINLTRLGGGSCIQNCVKPKPCKENERVRWPFRSKLLSEERLWGQSTWYRVVGKDKEGSWREKIDVSERMRWRRQNDR